MQREAREALAARLRSLLPAGALHPGGQHALRFADALVPTLSDGDVAWAHEQLAARAKGELRPARSGAVQAHAAWSSTAFVCSAFAAWRSDPAALSIAGLSGFTELRLEERLHIPHGGGTPNLDVVCEGPGVYAGVESKLTEHLAPSPPRAWRPAYRRPAMLAALDGGWADVFAALLSGDWAPRFLDAAQLVKHALSLQRPDAHLVLLYWEPVPLPELRAELAELHARLGPDPSPRFHAVTHDELLRSWTARRPDHVAALRERYGVAVAAG